MFGRHKKNWDFKNNNGILRTQMVINISHYNNCHPSYIETLDAYSSYRASSKNNSFLNKKRQIFKTMIILALYVLIISGKVFENQVKMPYPLPPKLITPRYTSLSVFDVIYHYIHCSFSYYTVEKCLANRWILKISKEFHSAIP